VSAGLTDAVLVVGAALAGALVAGPLVNHAVTWWIGWRAVVPPLLGRVPDRRELGRPRAACPQCGASQAPGGLPVRPGLALAGRCPGCRARLPAWLVAVEVVTAGLFAAAATVAGAELVLVPALTLVTGLVAMAAVDLAVMRIPSRFVYLTGAVVVAGLVAVSLVDGTPRRLWGAVLGAAVYGGMLLVLHLASPRMLGFGDVRLGTLVGLAVGWAGWDEAQPVFGPVQVVLNAALLAAVAGAVAGVILLVARGRDTPFPFGPAVAAAGLVVFLAGI
jgi:leader peptidase (prepilin peptidase)/N-methyltransferase